MKLYMMILFLFFVGCSRSATSVFKKDEIYAQNIQYTKIAKLSQNDKIEAIFNITYLNSVDSSRWDTGKQYFLIGSYLSDKNLEVTITLNDTKKLTTITLPKDVEKNIAFKNKWADYKIFVFKDIEDTKTLNLNILDNFKHSISVKFTKE